MSNPDDGFQDFAVPYVTPCPRLRARLVSRLRSSQALAVHSRANFGIKGSSHASSLEMRTNFKSTTLVSRFRSSHHCATEIGRASCRERVESSEVAVAGN